MKSLASCLWSNCVAKIIGVAPGSESVNTFDRNEYLLIRGGLVTDFMEPQNLFALAINSSESQSLGGSCGGGPEKKEFEARWYINMENYHFSIQDRNEDPLSNCSMGMPIELDYADSPIMRTYSRLSQYTSSIV